MKRPITLWTLLFLTLFSTSPTRAQSLLLAWDTDGISGTPSQYSATTVGVGLQSSDLTRGAGLSPSSLSNAFSASAWTQTNRADALAQNSYFEVQLQAANGFEVSLSQIDFHFRRSSNGPDTLQWYYSINSGSFTPIGSFIHYGTEPTNGSAFGPINTSAISALQNVDSGNTITLRLYGWGASSSGGTGAIGRLSGDNLSLSGTATFLAGPANPTAFSSSTVASNQIDLSASSNASNDDIVVLWNTTNNFGTPTGSYTAGDPVSGGGTVLYAGVASGLGVHSALIASTIYYYKAFSFDGTDYSFGLSLQDTTLSSGLPITALGQEFRVDFDNNFTGVHRGQIQGNGFAPDPAPGQLNSGAWAMTGMSDGNLLFGGNQASGDFARGTGTGGVGTGGCYAFEVESGNFALGFQPIDSDFAPGTLTLRLHNLSGSTFHNLLVAYKVYEYNDQDRANFFNIKYSTDDNSYTSLTTLNFESRETQEQSPQWKAHYRLAYIENISVPDNGHFYLQWESDDVSGSSNRDELALDDITVVASPGNPEIDLAGGSFRTVSVGAGAELEVQAGSSLSVEGALRNEGIIRIANTASLVQTEATNNNSGAGQYFVNRQITATDERRFNYWSSPVSGANFGEVFGSNSGSPTNPADWYHFDESSQNWMSVSGESTSFTAGKGYLSTPTPQGNTNSITESRTFSGTIHNGDYSTSYTAAANHYILVGNPYPGAIDIAAFNTENTDLTGTVYFWDARGNYGNRGYASWNSSGSARANAGPQARTPDDFVQATQGFFVQADNANPTVKFTNAMRVEGSNSQFFKRKRPHRERLWLSLRNDSNGYNQVLLSYDQLATKGKDKGLDGLIYKANPQLAFYSQMEGEDYVIQARPKLDAGEYDLIPLGVDAWVPGNYRISIDSLDHWQSGYGIFLIDSLAGQMIDLQKSDYSFHLSATGQVRNRFFLYINQVNHIGLRQNLAPSLSFYQSGKTLVIDDRQSTLALRQAALLSLNGQTVLMKDLEANQFQHRLNIAALPRGVYVLRAESRSGEIRHHKIYLQ